MDAPLYDFSPIARLLLMAILMATAPLAWVWLKNKNKPPLHRLRALTLLTLFFTFDLLGFGAFTRLTHSGLGLSLIHI
jgi:cytochrome c oxidase assembly protein subunit 15